MHRAQDVEIDPESRTVRRGGVDVRLSRKEYDLVHALIARAGEVVTRDELMRQVWRADFWTSTKTIDVHLGWVRRKLGDDPRRPTLITTLRGRGLRFETEPPDDVDRTAPPAATLAPPTSTPGTTAAAAVEGTVGAR